jgi:DNA-binding PadR family transcriptional regulator
MESTGDDLPQLTSLQYLVLSTLLDGDLWGREIREILALVGIHKHGPAFYQLISQIEDTGYVKGWYHEKIVDGQRLNQRRYRITSKGIKAREEFRDFAHNPTKRPLTQEEGGK